MIVMERLQEPYMLMRDFFTTCTLHSVHYAIHYTLCMIRTHLHPVRVVHGDLHFGNIFVDQTIGNFAFSAKPIQFIDFGRTTVLSDDFPKKDIELLRSIDVMALVRAACRACIKASTRGPKSGDREHMQATCVIDVVTHFLDYKDMKSFSALRLLAIHHMPPDFLKTETKKGTCRQCAEMYDWIEYLLKHKCCVRKDGDGRKLSFLDITAG